LYFESGNADEAIAHYSRSLQLNPASASTHYNIGIALAARGRRNDAIAHFEQALRLDPEYAQAHNNFGALLYLVGRRTEAAGHFRKAIALRPDNLEARTNLAALLAADGAAAEALEQYRAALRIKPDDPKALAGAAWIRATIRRAFAAKWRRSRDICRARRPGDEPPRPGCYGRAGCGVCRGRTLCRRSRSRRIGKQTGGGNGARRRCCPIFRTRHPVSTASTYRMLVPRSR
jgi:tetratricopeptide (TPR) repeat protein